MEQPEIYIPPTARNANKMSNRCVYVEEKVFGRWPLKNVPSSTSQSKPEDDQRCPGTRQEIPPRNLFRVSPFKIKSTDNV